MQLQQLEVRETPFGAPAVRAHECLHWARRWHLHVCPPSAVAFGLQPVNWQKACACCMQLNIVSAMPHAAMKRFTMLN